MSPEQRASDQLVNLEKDEEYNPYAYFTKDFFPCQPDCDMAAQMGKEIHDALKAIDPHIAEEYLSYLSQNVDLVRQYPEIIQKKIELLERVAATTKTQEGDRVE